LDYDEIVVSASKQKEKIFDAPATISLVNQRKIREFSGNDIGSALNKVKGMEI
jgi:outer membrane receptor for ferrienterochelin and colicin